MPRWPLALGRHQDQATSNQGQRRQQSFWRRNLVVVLYKLPAAFVLFPDHQQRVLGLWQWQLFTWLRHQCFTPGATYFARWRGRRRRKEDRPWHPWTTPLMRSSVYWRLSPTAYATHNWILTASNQSMEVYFTYILYGSLLFIHHLLWFVLTILAPCYCDQVPLIFLPLSVAAVQSSA